MPYIITHNKAQSFKGQIIKMWNEYLPGTPGERFEWMQDNPAGDAIWYLAIDEKSNELAGTISIMPRNMTINNRNIKVGIVGDFMTGYKYRVFGPAIELQKTVINSMSELGLEFIYSIPNDASIKLAERVGFRNIAKLLYLVKPIKLDHYLCKYINRHLSKLISPIVEQLLKIISKESYVISKGVYKEHKSINGSFDIFWERYKDINSGLIGNHDSDYLQWRFKQNPLQKYRILSYEEKASEDISGYIIFCINTNKMEIHDVVSFNEKITDKLIKKIIEMARKENCQAIYIRISEENPLMNQLKNYRFIDAKGDACVLVYGKNESIYEHWSFFEGDRNL